MSAEEIDYVLDRIYAINKYLGGVEFESDYRTKNQSLFKTLNHDFIKKFEEVKKIQDQRDDWRRVEETSLRILRANNQINNGITFMENIIDKMMKHAKGLKTASVAAEEGEEVLFNCQNLLEKFKEKNYFQYAFKKEQDAKKAANKKLKKKDYQKALIDLIGDETINSDDEGTDNPMKKKKKDKGGGGEGKKVDKKALNQKQNQLRDMKLLPQEKTALDEWKNKDAEIDDMLDEIDVDIDRINVQLDAFQENMRKNEILIEYISNEVFKITTELQTSNAQLKIIMEKFRQPGRLCIDICVAIMFSTLLGLLIYLIMRYTSL